MFKRMAVVLVGLLFTLATVVPATAQQELVEVRFYHFRSSDSAAQFDQMVTDAALPLMKEAGIGPVGVFKVIDSPQLDENSRVTIVPYKSMEQMLELRKSFASDAQFLSKASDYLDQETGNPAFDRIESMLLQSFSGMPKMKAPDVTESKDRLFELRTYKSENEVQQDLKVKMFNEGEIDIFKKTGLNAVFFGDAIVAPNLPQLTYMLVHEDKAAQDASWQTFISSPDWKALSGQQQYKVIKLQITKHMLKATDYSPIQ